MGIHRDAAMPQFAGRTFQAWARKHRPPASKKRVVYFHGCGANYYEPRLGEMTVAVLAPNGFAVDVPKQGCRRLPLQSNGMFDGPRTAAPPPSSPPSRGAAAGAPIGGGAEARG